MADTERRESPTADNKRRISMYRKMAEAKLFEEELHALLTSGQLDAHFFFQRGQEAIAIATGASLRKDDYLVTNYRTLADQVGKGVDLYKVLAEIYGHEDGYCRGRGGTMHYMDWSLHTLSTGIIGGGMVIAVGLGMAAKYSGSDAVVVSVFGEGATNHGSFHEAMNLASLWDSPVIFVCQNNGYAEMTAQRDHQKKVNVAERASAYDIPGQTVDGNDPDICYEAISSAVARARAGLGPTFVEAKTYRFLGHVIGDPMLYMPPGELADRRQKDPVPQYRARLLHDGTASPNELDAIDREIRESITRIFEKAITGREAPLTTLTNYVYADNSYF